MKKTLLTLSIVVSLAACSQIPKQAYYNRGQPEALLDVTSDQTVVDISARNGLRRLSDAISQNSPSSAELSCSNRMLCTRATEILNQYGVPYQMVGDRGNSVTLTYKNIVARDCENRYIDNHINPYNLNHPTFGCSIAANQVQMVSDKRQFVDPLLLGSYDGEKAAQNYDTYLSRDPLPLARDASNSGPASSNSGGGR